MTTVRFLSPDLNPDERAEVLRVVEDTLCKFDKKPAVLVISSGD